MKLIPRILLFVFLFVTVAAYAGQKRGESKSICILIDFSQSTKNARDDYKEALKTIFGSIRMGDSLYVSKITEKSKMEPRPIAEEDFIPKKEPANDFWKKQESIKMDKKIKGVKEKAIKIIDEQQLSGKTALMDSLQVAERVFKKYKKDKSVLIIMSDMVEDSKYNFEKETLDDKEISKIIQAQKKQDNIPDLRGVKVYVVGASVPKGVRQAQYDHIQKFWFSYLKETGANMLKENYGCALIGFKE